jgi:hypothetical protein
MSRAVIEMAQTRGTQPVATRSTSRDEKTCSGTRLDTPRGSDCAATTLDAWDDGLCSGGAVDPPRVGGADRVDGAEAEAAVGGTSLAPAAVVDAGAPAPAPAAAAEGPMAADGSARSSRRETGELDARKIDDVRQRHQPVVHRNPNALPLASTATSSVSGTAAQQPLPSAARRALPSGATVVCTAERHASHHRAGWRHVAHMCAARRHVHSWPECTRRRKHQVRRCASSASPFHVAAEAHAQLPRMCIGQCRTARTHGHPARSSFLSLSRSLSLAPPSSVRSRQRSVASIYPPFDTDCELVAVVDGRPCAPVDSAPPRLPSLSPTRL